MTSESAAARIAQHERDGTRLANSRRAMEIGTAAEHLVCAHLLIAGYRAYQSAQGLPYDVVLDVGSRLLRVAVKGTLKASPRPGRPGSDLCYQYGATRSSRGRDGKTIARPYTAHDADLMAFVAIDAKIVAYAALGPVFPSMWQMDAPGSMRVDRDRLGRLNRQHRKRFEDFTLDAALRAVGAL